MTGLAAPLWAPELPAAHDWGRWGIDPSWSRRIEVPSRSGGSHRWHVLDTGRPTDAPPNAATVLCVHGNPTWGYAWAGLLQRLSPKHRVVAIDQLGMGYSDRTEPRRYVDRVGDLDDVVTALGLPDGVPLVVAAHDWGGAIAMGWVVQDPGRVAGLILCNTGIAVPEGRKAPGIIRLAASAPLLDVLCRATMAFVEGTLRLSGRRLTSQQREAFRAPYHSAPARAAIADFVADIPLRPEDPSAAAIADVAARLHGVHCPVLLAWGAKDPVFNGDFAADLTDRLPNTILHRFPDASHLVMAEADVAAVAETWLDDLARRRLSTGDPVADQPTAETGVDTTARPPLWAQVAARRGDHSEAFIDMATRESITFAELHERVESVASELARRGLRRGERVAMLTPPGVDLVAAVYGVWRAGGVAVLADRGLGLRGLRRAVRSTQPAWVIGPRKALAAATALRWAPRATQLEVGRLVHATRGVMPDPPVSHDDAAVLFTSGATGAAKGVCYLHGQLAAQRDALRVTYDIGDTDRLVAAFAPFSLYGPALGIPTALPDCDVTSPGDLTWIALDDACRRVGATMVFASPSALANTVDTGERADTPDTTVDVNSGDEAAATTLGEDHVGPSARVAAGIAALRLVMSAGAPVPAETLRAVSRIAPSAELRTPYGMTEVLPVADIGLDEIERAEAAEPTGGVCVGPVVHDAMVRIVPLGFDPHSLPDAVGAGVTGEIMISAPWVSEGYVGAWAAERAARPPAAAPADGSASGGPDPRVWHRSGDVGHVDGEGRLWVEGRTVHVVSAVDGPVTPVPVERAVETGLGIRRSAAVGVGPPGRQQLVVVVEDRGGDEGLVSDGRSATVRSLVGTPVAAVLSLKRIPVDIRHNAKVDRIAVGRWAAEVLAGRRARPPK